MPLRIECYLPAFLHNLILLVLRGRPWALLQFSLAVARKLCLFMQNNLRCHIGLMKMVIKMKMPSLATYIFEIYSSTAFQRGIARAHRFANG